MDNNKFVALGFDNYVKLNEVVLVSEIKEEKSFSIKLFSWEKATYYSYFVILKNNRLIKNNFIDIEICRRYRENLLDKLEHIKKGE